MNFKNIVKKKSTALICYLAFACVATTGFAQDIPMSQKMANSIMSRYPNRYSGGGSREWNYVVGTVLKGFQNVYLSSGEEKYYTYIANTIDHSVSSDGSIATYSMSSYNIDNIREGASLLFMYEKTQLEKYKKAADTLRTQLDVGQHPRTSEGGFWHKQRYTSQMWLDGLYMGQPFYAEYTVLFKNADQADLDDVVKQFVLMEKHARDNLTGLYYHGWDEKKVQNWADPNTGCSKNFWGRGIGWFAMALVDVLDYLPQDYAKRGDMIRILEQLITALVKYQDPESGCWYQVVDKGDEKGNYLEASGSCMFTYAILKAVRLGYVDRRFLEAGKKGYEGILKTFVSEKDGMVNLNRISDGAGLSRGRDGSFKYYMSVPIVSNHGNGLGPFLSASVEYEHPSTKIAWSKVAYSQEMIIPLWPEGIPNHQESDEVEFTSQSGGISWIGNVQEPSLAVYSPAKMNATDMAVIVCPGGGYKKLAYDLEGLDIASWLNTKGITAFILKYRLPHSKSVITSHEAPLQDALRAVRTVRYNAEKWNISKNKIGIIGFSAAGHLVSTVGTHFNDNKTASPNAIDAVSARPDFMALIYPVITMNEPYVHKHSRKYLLGENPDQELKDYYSSEMHVTKDTPPTFLVHSSDDTLPVENSLLFYQALRKEKIYCEMHIYASGGHGYSLAVGKGHLQTWPDRLYDWILSLEEK